VPGTDGAATIAGEAAVLAKPETFMNLSGLAVRELVAEHQVDVSRDLIVFTTNWTCRWARFASAAGEFGGAQRDGIHPGRSGTDEFLRIRLGVSPGAKLRTA